MDKLTSLVNQVEQFRSESSGRTRPYPETIKRHSVSLLAEHGVQGVAVACKIPESLIYKWQKQSRESGSVKYSRISKKTNRVSVVRRGEVQLKAEKSKPVEKSVFKIRHTSGYTIIVRTVDDVAKLLSRLS